MSPIRHLLVHLTEGARADTLLRLAGALADRHAAAITALAALPSPLRGALLSAEGAALAVQVAADEQQRLRAAAAARCAEAAARGTPAIALQCAEGDADVLLRAASRTADLLLVGQPAGESPAMARRPGPAVCRAVRWSPGRASARRRARCATRCRCSPPAPPRSKW